jgi:RNA polymerase sigma-70 factor (ECF subfamily)
VASETSALATVELAHPRRKLQRRLSAEQQRWLADIYRANASAVYFVCQFLLRKPEDAADATQDVFLKAVESLRGRSTPERARSWLLSAAQNHCLEVLRRHHHVERIATNPGTDSAGDADPETAVVERDIVSTVFRELRARERHALWRWAVESRPLSEIANDLGLSYTAVQQLLFRARRHAASVAAMVAALLGLLQLGRALRRASHAYQMALVAAVVPVILVSMPSSSSANPAIASPPSQAVPLHAVPTQSGRGVIPSRATPPAGTLELPQPPVALPSAVLDPATSAVDGAVSTLERSVRQVVGGIGAAPGANGVLPGQIPVSTGIR